jgi:hypothetical protein
MPHRTASAIRPERSRDRRATRPLDLRGESAGDTETDDSANAARDFTLEKARKAPRIRLRRQSRPRRARGNARFSGKPGNRDDREPRLRSAITCRSARCRSLEFARLR